MLRLLLTACLSSWFVLAAGSRARAAQPPETLRQRAHAVLAQLDGQIAVPGLKEPVEVLRDRWGVPHIYAKNQDDLFLAQGFVVAQDRLFQLDTWRRVGTGQTAELLGPQALEGDRFARLLLYRGDMDAEWRAYSPDTQRIATAFTRGINAYIDHIGDRLPVEFQLLNARPGRWRPEDVLARMSGIIMSGNFSREVARSQLVAAVGLEKARRLAPTDPRIAYAPPPGLDLAGIDVSVLAGLTAATRGPDFKLAASASNNWAIDASLSTSGKPMLASDPHRALTLPSLRYLVHLNAPGWNVIGAGEPALPGVAIGHNERIAWGFTIVGTDLADLYVEETHPDDPTRYKVGDGWQKMRIVRETVNVRGAKKPAEIELRFTRHGPILHQDLKRRRAYALRWSGSDPGGAAYLDSLAIDRADSWKGFLGALHGWKIPALNMVYADVDGNIGWVAAGRTPVRKGWDGLFPVLGAAGRYEWQGFLDVKDLPQTFNPAKHFVATANHNIVPPGYRHHISYEWTPIYRYARIQHRLEAKAKFDLEDFKSIQHDVTSIPGQALVRLIKLADVPDPALKPYAKLLAGWDGVLGRDAQAGPLYAAWLRELQTTFHQMHLPKDLPDAVRLLCGVPVVLAALEHPDRAWFGDDATAARDQLLRTTFARAVKKVQTLAGKDPGRWGWGKHHTAAFRHPLASLGPAYEKAFNLGPVSRSGDGWTPNNTGHDENFRQASGASYRHVFDLADWDRGMATSTPGQSGQPGSPHYGDLMELWGKDEYFPLAFSRSKVEQVSRHRLLLKPTKE